MFIFLPKIGIFLIVVAVWRDFSYGCLGLNNLKVGLRDYYLNEIMLCY